MNVTRTLLFIAATLCGTTLAHAQNGPVAAACSNEIQKYCASIPHGQGKVRQCLVDNIDKASAECRGAIEGTGPGKGARMSNPD